MVELKILCAATKTRHSGRNKYVKKRNVRFLELPGGPVAKTLHSQCRGSCSIPGRGTRSRMLTLKVLHAAVKTRYS